MRKGEALRGQALWGRWGVISLLMSLAALSMPAGAAGTLTIGSNLGRAPSTSHQCTPNCTVAPVSLSAAASAPGGVISPVNGTIVTWRIRAGGMVSPVSFRVLNRSPDGFATGAGTSEPATPLGNDISSFSAQLPIKVGQTIGIDCCTIESVYEAGATGTEDVWLPVLPDGGPPQDTFLNSPPNAHELLIIADIQPVSAFTISAIKPGKGGKLTVTANMPNPGTLEGGDKRDARLAATAAKKKAKYLQHARMPVGVAGQTIRLLLKPTKLTRSVLAERGKLKVKAKVVFTPTGGSPSAQIVRAKLRR
jgi:hypothetical protein